jgi:putative ABC transport system permease protein
MHTLLQDLRYGARMLWKKPGFTAVAVITLALGIGANTAIFSVVNAVLLKPLPYPESERIVRVGQQFGGELWAAGEPKFLFWRERSRSFESLAAYQYLGSGYNLTGGSEPEFVSALRVSADFFRVLGVSPGVGRSFTKEEDTSGGERVVILSDGLWQRRFGADAGLVGKTVALNGQPHTVVGVMPPDFRMVSTAADVFVPMRPSLAGDPNPNHAVIGRLKDGVTLAESQAELKSIADEYRAAFPNQMRQNESAGAEPYEEMFKGGVRRLLWILLGAVGFVLLIACANVANLQLTRAASRTREMAIRQAMGAGGWRITRQLLTEGVLLALAGGAAGWLLAAWGTELLVAAMPPGLLARVSEISYDWRAGGISFDWRVLAFTCGVAVVTGLLFGLAPAWQARRVDLNSALKEGGDKGSSGAGRGRLRSALVVAEVALSLVLLVGATLLMQTFVNLRGVEPGFDPRGVLTFQVSPGGERYDTAAKTADFYRAAIERIRAVPGVESAAVTSTLPIASRFNMPFVTDRKPDAVNSAEFRLVTPDYFRVLKIGVRQGRAFTPADAPGAEGVVIVNESFARRYLNEGDPLTRRVTVGRGAGEASRRVVGVVGDVKQFGLDSSAPPMIFVPAAQASDELLKVTRRFLSPKFVVRTAGDPLTFAGAIKRELAAVDPTLPLSQVRGLEEIVGRSVAPQRFNMLLTGVLAGLGLLLAGVGIYGVVSYAVAERTREIGVRMALGAAKRDVLRLVIGQGMKPTLIGVAVGVAAALALTRLMKSLLFGVGANDPLTFAGVAAMLAGVALAACWMPARRAAKVDPMIALRCE